MKLSDTQKQVYEVLQFDSTSSCADIANRLQISANAVNHARKRLLQSKYMFRTFILNYAGMNLNEWLVYFSVKGDPACLLQFLKSSQRVAWLCESGSEYQYFMSVICASADQLDAFLEKLMKDHKAIFSEKACLQILRKTFYGRRYLYNVRNVPIQPIDSPPVPGRKLGEHEHAFLDELSKDPSKSNAGIAAALQINSSTLDYRIAKMRSDGVVSAFMYGVPGIHPGIQHYRIVARTVASTSNPYAALQKFAKENTNVVGILKTFGAWDYEIRVEIEHSCQLSSVLHNLKRLPDLHFEPVRAIPVTRVLRVESYPFKDYNLLYNNI